MKPKISTLAEKNPHAFVESITQLWSHFQRLIFCYDFIADKIKNFSLFFNKVAVNYTALLKGETIGPVAVMGSLQLEKFIENYKPLVKNFSKVFCNFIAE